jgi:hypothetical protein
MAISNTSIQIKRSSSTNIPSGLKSGELAYSFSSNTLFLGNTAGTGVVNIGGLYYTQAVDNATNNATALTLVKRDATGNATFNYVFANIVGTISGTANAATYLQNPQNFSISGGDITASAVSFNGSSAVTLSASLNSVSGLTAGTYGGATNIPVIQVAANGRVMAISNTSLSTSFTVSGNTGSGTQNTGGTLTFQGNGTGITTTVTGSGGSETVTFATDSTVARTNTASIGPQTISTDLTVAGNLIVTGTQTFVNTATVQTNDSLIKLAANNNTADVVDIGFYGGSNTGSSVQYHGLIREGSGGTSAGNFYLFKNLITDPTGNTVNYASLTKASLIADLSLSTGLSLTTGVTGVLPVANGGTGTTTSTGTGSVVLSNNPTFGGTTNFTNINTASITVGTTTFVANNLLGSFSANSNTFSQFVIQNANTGTQASVDFVVNNDKSTNDTFFGDFGMNSSGFSGPGVLDKPNAVYLYSQDSDLVLGTHTANAIHFVVNNGTTDAMNISSTGVVSLGTALAVPSGGTGATSFNSGQMIVGNGTGALQSLANSSLTITGTSGLQNNTITSVSVDAYGRTTAITYSAIAGLTVGQGGTGASSFTTNGITYGNGTGAIGVTAAAGTSDQTWSNQILTVTNAGVPVWTTTMDGGTF